MALLIDILFCLFSRAVFPSVLHSLWGKMKVSLPQLETGSKLTIHTNITTGLGGKFQCNLRNQSYTTEMDLPQERQEILSTR